MDYCLSAYNILCGFKKVVCIQFFSDQDVPTNYGNYIPPFLFVPWFRQHAKFSYHISYLFAPYETIYEACDIPLHWYTHPAQLASHMTSSVVVPCSKFCILPKCTLVLQKKAVSIPLSRVGVQTDLSPWMGSFGKKILWVLGWAHCSTVRHICLTANSTRVVLLQTLCLVWYVLALDTLLERLSWTPCMELLQWVSIGPTKFMYKKIQIPP